LAKHPEKQRERSADSVVAGWANLFRHLPEDAVVDFVGEVDRLLDGATGRRHADVDLGFPRQPDAGDEAGPEVDHSAVDSRHVSVGVEHQRGLARF
jgi:hypothetical protein